jgi:hypothetical protein
MPTLNDLDSLAKSYADQHDRLAAKVRSVNDDIEHVKRRALPAIRAAVVATATAREGLVVAIKASPDLFIRPRTQLLHGIKCGFQKSRGKLFWASKEQVVALIKRVLPGKMALLIKTTEKPVKKALERLTVDELKKIGVTVGETSDQVVADYATGEIDKLVNALLGEAVSEEQDVDDED